MMLCGCRDLDRLLTDEGYTVRAADSSASQSGLRQCHTIYGRLAVDRYIYLVFRRFTNLGRAVICLHYGAKLYCLCGRVVGVNIFKTCRIEREARSGRVVIDGHKCLDVRYRYTKFVCICGYALGICYREGTIDRASRKSINF